MTFGVIRRGRLAATVRADTLEALLRWYEPSPGDRLAILADETLRVGERVEVTEVRVGIAQRRHGNPGEDPTRWRRALPRRGAAQGCESSARCSAPAI